MQKQRVKPDPKPGARPTLANLAAWLKTKNPNGVYCYNDNAHCLLKQWQPSWEGSNGKRTDLIYPGDISKPRSTRSKIECVAIEGPSTYGAAFKRTRAYIRAANAR